MSQNLQQKFNQEIVPALKVKLGYKNLMQVPRVKKVVINVGTGKFGREPQFLEMVEKNLAKITGQKPVRTKSKKSISNFKVREGMEIGVMVTLRGKRMFHFLEKLLKVTFPRVRDFRGLSGNGFDKQGNYAIGFKEQVAFPEITAVEADKLHGLQVVVQTSARNQAEGKELLTQLGFPFVK